MKKEKKSKELDPFLQELVDEMWGLANALQKHNIDGIHWYKWNKRRKRYEEER